MDYTEESRNSLRNHLNRGNFSGAAEKINDNLNLIQQNNKDLQDYLFKIGSKKDNKELIDKADKIILKTGQIFTETYNFIKDVAEFKYLNKNEKIDNIKKAKNFEQLCNKQKEKFDAIVNKIQRQDQAFIESTRNSIRMSFSQNRDMSDMNVDNKEIDLLFKNGKEYLESNIDERQKQIELITKVTNQIEDLSKTTNQMVIKQGEKILTIEDDINNANFNISNAAKEIKQADSINKSSGSLINKVLYIVVIVVLVLIFLSWIMP